MGSYKTYTNVKNLLTTLSCIACDIRVLWRSEIKLNLKLMCNDTTLS